MLVVVFASLLLTSCFLLARGTDEAARVVGLAEGGHHLPFNEVLAAEAASSVHSLVVQSTDVFTLPHKEASLGQFTTTYCDKGGGGGGGRKGKRVYDRERGKRMGKKGQRKGKKEERERL